MTRRDSKKAGERRRASGETLWNVAAVAGLLAVGLLLGGVLGVILDREGLLGDAGEAAVATTRPVVPAGPQSPIPAAAAQVSEAPQREVLQASPPVDREALEAAYQQALRALPPEGPDDRPAVPPVAPPAATPPTGPAVSADGPARWQQHAVAVEARAGRPMIAIVLDDVGVNRRAAARAIALPGPLTLSFMTYANGLAEMTAKARQAGHELMLHVPMQPQSDAIDPGPNVLSAELPPAELQRRLTWGLDRFDGYVGINNHMGSRFTASDEGMALVMAELKARGLLFLDSLTAASSVAGHRAAGAGVPYAVRDVFIDNTPDDPAAIRRQLAILERQALKRGYAVGIGHPHDGTVAALAKWIPEVRARGFALVPISAVVRYRQRLAAGQTAGAG